MIIIFIITSLKIFFQKLIIGGIKKNAFFLHYFINYPPSHDLTELKKYKNGRLLIFNNRMFLERSNNPIFDNSHSLIFFLSLWLSFPFFTLVVPPSSWLLYIQKIVILKNLIIP